MKSWPLMILGAALLVAVAACSGGSGGDDVSNQPGGDAAAKDQPAGDQAGDDAVADVPDDGDGDGTGSFGVTSDGSSDAIVSNAIEALGLSAESLEQDVESMRAEMMIDMESNDFSMRMSGELAFELPDKMYMVMEIDGDLGDLADEGLDIDPSDFGDIEMLVLGDVAYMKMPLFGWVTMPADEADVDFGDIDSLTSGDFMIGYGDIVDEVAAYLGIEDLGEESIDGGTYQHYRVTIDADEAMDTFANTFAGDEQLFADGDVNVDGAMTMDIWVDADTYLPHMVTADGSFSDGSEEMTMNMVMEFFDYNQPIDFPDPPADAVSFADMFDFGEGFDFDVDFEDPDSDFDLSSLLE
jgi:outer membrane lipoprotein-sorting protein